MRVRRPVPTAATIDPRTMKGTYLFEISASDSSVEATHIKSQLAGEHRRNNYCKDFGKGQRNELYTTFCS